jgi:hypothetical protein
MRRWRTKCVIRNDTYPTLWLWKDHSIPQRLLEIPGYPLSIVVRKVIKFACLVSKMQRVRISTSLPDLDCVQTRFLSIQI